MFVLNLTFFWASIFEVRRIINLIVSFEKKSFFKGEGKHLILPHVTGTLFKKLSRFFLLALMVHISQQG